MTAVKKTKAPTAGEAAQNLELFGVAEVDDDLWARFQQGENYLQEAMVFMRLADIYMLLAAGLKTSARDLARTRQDVRDASRAEAAAPMAGLGDVLKRGAR